MMDPVTLALAKAYADTKGLRWAESEEQADRMGGPVLLVKPSTYLNSVLSDRPVMFLSGVEDGVWTDRSGNGLHGTINGATYQETDGPGLGIGDFMLFDPSSHAMVPHHPLLNLRGSVTVEVWVRRPSAGTLSGHAPFLQKENLWLTRYSSSAQGVVARIDVGRQIVTSSTLPANLWVCLWLIFDQPAGTLKVWRRTTTDSDLVLLGEQDVGHEPINSGTTDLFLGGNPLAGSYQDIGLTCPAIYDYALSADRMNAHYQMGVNGP